MLWICLSVIGLLVYVFLGVRAFRRKDRDLEVKANTFLDLLAAALDLFGAV